MRWGNWALLTADRSCADGAGNRPLSKSGRMGVKARSLITGRTNAPTSSMEINPARARLSRQVRNDGADISTIQRRGGQCLRIAIAGTSDTR